MVDPVAFLPVCIFDRRDRPDVTLQTMEKLRKRGLFRLPADSCSMNDSSEIGIKSLHKLGLQGKITCTVRRRAHNKSESAHLFHNTCDGEFLCQPNERL